MNFSEFCQRNAMTNHKCHELKTEEIQQLVGGGGVDHPEPPNDPPPSS